MPDIEVPEIDAGIERDLTEVPFLIPLWLVPQILGYLEELTEPDFWEGSDEQIAAATTDAENGIYTLVRQVEGLGVEDVRLNSNGQLEKWDGSAWQAAGEVAAIESAEAETLEPNQPATAVITDGVLQVGVPKGEKGDVGFETVEAETLAAGSAATAALEGSNLVFGIPRGYNGTDGTNGTSVTAVYVEVLPVGSQPTVISFVGGVLTLGLPPAPQGQSQDVIYGFPDITDDEKLCQAVKAVEKSITDFSQDVLQFINFGQAMVFAAGELAALIPTIPIFNTGYELFFEDLPEIIFDAVLTNMVDEDARRLVQEKLFCAYKECYPNVDEVWDHITLPSGLTWDFSLNANLFTWNNAKAWWEFVSGSLDGSFAGFITLAMTRFLSDGLGAFGVTEPMSKVFGNAYNTASVFNLEGDCSTFECVDPPVWEHFFDFTENNGDFTAITAEGGARASYEAGVAWDGVVNVLGSNTGELRIHKPSLSSDAIVTHIEVTYTTPVSTEFNFNFDSTALDTLAPATGGFKAISCEVPIVSEGLHCRVDLFASSGSYLIQLISLKLSGTGENPFV